MSTDPLGTGNIDEGVHTSRHEGVLWIRSKNTGSGLDRIPVRVLARALDQMSDRLRGVLESLRRQVSWSELHHETWRRKPLLAYQYHKEVRELSRSRERNKRIGVGSQSAGSCRKLVFLKKPELRHLYYG